MNRKEFLKELRRELEAFSFEEREAAIAYYEEYLDEAGPENEAAAIQGFGSPRTIAAGIQAEQVIKAVNIPPKTPKEGFRKVWLVILAIFAVPVGFPLAIAGAAIIFSLFIAIASVIFAFGITAIALVGAGIFSLIASFSLVVSAPATFLFYLGSGIAATGLGILFTMLTYFLATRLLGGFAKLLGKVLNRRKRGA